MPDIGERRTTAATRRDDLARLLNTFYLSPAEAARRLGRTRRLVHKRVRLGTLAGLRTPLGHLIAVETVERELAARRAREAARRAREAADAV